MIDLGSPQLTIILILVLFGLIIFRRPITRLLRKICKK